MKISTPWTLLVLIAVATCTPVEELKPRVSGENGWYVPHVDGSFEWVAMDEFSLLDFNAVEEQNQGSGWYVPIASEGSFDGGLLDVDLSRVHFYLYTRSNPTEAEKIHLDYEYIKESNFNKDDPTRFIIHGWLGSSAGGLNPLVRDAWLSHGEYNIVVVDWSYHASTYNYVSAVSYVPTVGKIVAKMIDFLHSEYELSYDNLTLIGHSLGAHVCGFAGKNIKNGTIHTIVGLDPALPLFDIGKPEQRLSSTDAFYVESIHTNGGKLGFLQPIGKTAFYPNGGEKQPGCGVDFWNTCAHARSYVYYAEAVSSNSFPSIICKDYKDAVSKVCGSNYTLVRMAAGTNAYMDFKDTLTFFVPVNEQAPFAQNLSINTLSHNMSFVT